MAKKDREVTFHHPEIPTEAKEIRNKDGEVTGWAAAQADWLVRMPENGDASKTETTTVIGEKTQETAKEIAGAFGDLSVKITVDTSEAVAELKRLQRVARQVTKELREVEANGHPFGNAKFPVDILRSFTTQELADELTRRAKNGEPGVGTFEVGDGKDVEAGEAFYFDGDAKVIVIYGGVGE